MVTGHFYFLSDQYFIDFPDHLLMSNKESSNGTVHDRPCFCAFQDEKTGLFWMIPISSQIGKFRQIQQDKLRKYGHCDTIDFGRVLGHEKAFLIQNMCPAADTYIKNEYLDARQNQPVKLDGVFKRQLLQKARKVLALQRKGRRLIFPDVLLIEQQLLA